MQTPLLEQVEPRLREQARELICAHPLATLITTSEIGIAADCVPFVLVEEQGGWWLRAHLARNHPRLRCMTDKPVLVVFQGANGYVTPTWYPGKPEHGRVVPTWLYSMVQLGGQARLVDDPAWLAAQLMALTELQERELPQPWRVADAPADYLAALKRGIIGLEIAVTSLEGRWKLGQQRSVADRLGVLQGLTREGDNPLLVAQLTALEQARQ